MRKTITLVLFLLLTAMQMAAVRSYPRPRTIAQPDGSTLTIIGHGDEFRHYVTTTDGYTVIKGGDGVYRYAVLAEGRLKASAVKARDIESRTLSDKNFLRSIQPGLCLPVSVTGMKLKKLSSKKDAPLFKKRGAGVSGKAQSRKKMQTPYRGLVIMVNFTDRKFSRGDKAWELVNDMMNKPDYTYYDDPLLKGRIRCTGSVRDYFNDNSDSRFIPEFDVVGPIDVDVDQYYINTTDLTYELSRKVLEAADSEIDYSRYDSDGDGEVDMFYILYAGYASVYQGNDERLVWPHAGHFEDFEDSGNQLELDGVRFGRFACSSEIYGWHDEGDLYLDGIGVIVHEFSHLLGFKDHYDVSGYLNEDPGSWDVMASGNYNGVLNDTPCGYNSYERYAAGFLTPRTVTRENDGETVSLRPLSASGDALRVVSMQDSTVFMLENRQLEKWDKDLTGHGMLVWRVDSCDNEYWEHNALNVNGRLHFKLVRAAGATRTMFREIEDMDYDPFPGTRNIYDLTNYSIESNLLTDDRYPSPVMFRNIKENDGIISLALEDDPIATVRPYTFSLYEHYSATGLNDDDTDAEWNVRVGTVQVNGQERRMIYNLVPDARNISASNPKYADGLGALYALSGDRKNIIIEPYRVALWEDYGVWLVDFNDLDNGGSGAIVLDMNPYGDISLSNPDSMLGYCLLPSKSVVVTPDKIVERFSIVKDVRFNSQTSGIPYDMTVKERMYPENDVIFNMQGIRVNNPQKGELYIIGGKKVIFR